MTSPPNWYNEHKLIQWTLYIKDASGVVAHASNFLRSIYRTQRLWVGVAIVEKQQLIWNTKTPGQLSVNVGRYAQLYDLWRWRLVQNSWLAIIASSEDQQFYGATRSTETGYRRVYAGRGIGRCGHPCCRQECSAPVIIINKCRMHYP